MHVNIHVNATCSKIPLIENKTCLFLITLNSRTLMLIKMKLFICQYMHTYTYPIPWLLGFLRLCFDSFFCIHNLNKPIKVYWQLYENYYILSYKQHVTRVFFYVRVCYNKKQFHALEWQFGFPTRQHNIFTISTLKGICSWHKCQTNFALTHISTLQQNV